MELKYIIIIAAVAFLLLVIVGLSIVNYSSEDLLDKFKQTARYSIGVTPNEFARLINSIHFNNNIKIKYKDGLFVDSFNGNGTLTLSTNYANDYNMAAVAICAHELGHAFQYKDKSQMMRSHTKKIILSKSICGFTTPLIVGGIVAIILGQIYLGIGLVCSGALTFLIAVITKLSTLKIESGASKKALELLSVYANFTDDELKLAKAFLNSAKQTYLAELLRIVLKWTFLVKKR